MKQNEEGIFYGEDEAVYHADAVYEIPSFSASLGATLIDKTPMHMRHASQRLNPHYEREDDEKFDRGTLAHALILKSDAAFEILPYPNWKTKEARGRREAARATGRIPILEADFAEVSACAEAQEALLDQLDGGHPFFGGHPEVVIRWREEFVRHGVVYCVWCRARLDYLNLEHENAYDLKSTKASANPKDWTRRTMWSIGAPYQACLYRRGLRRLTQLGKLKMHDPDFIFIVVESVAPFALSAINVPSDIRLPYSDQTADDRLLEAMATWQDCLEAGRWPGYDPEIYVAQSIGRPPTPQPQWSDQKEWADDHYGSETVARDLDKPTNLFQGRKL